MNVANHDDATSAARFPVVGIGASAGGLAAFGAFFEGMPADRDPGMAFVLVQHLAPDHESILAELMRRYTRMEVLEIEDGMVVRPDRVYILPPAHDLAFQHGKLQLLAPAPRGLRLPIDSFFRSLAADLHERAIGIVLSGTGSDGTLGVRAIKAEGGLVLAQSSASAGSDGMPRSAMATGCVDYELPPEEMPARLIAYTARAFGGAPRGAPEPESPRSARGLAAVFVILRAQTGHDFSQYKPTTLLRRVERRMAVHQIDAIDAYVRYLQEMPAEVQALFCELLIGVTSFFRDRETFAFLEAEAIPKLFADKPRGAPVRVWSVGCSTGEETYSLAMLLEEHLEAHAHDGPVQVFGTDLDRRGIATARAGVYPASIEDDVSPERLARFFTREADGASYRVNKRVRDRVVFSEHDVIKDPPFSRLDLLSCRNLLIYLESELQRRLLGVFHYALKPGGVLFLGTSETVSDADALFTPLDRTAKIFLRSKELPGAQPARLDRFTSRLARERLPTVAATTTPTRSLREVTEQALLQHVAVAAALVDDRGDIRYTHGRTGMYLEPTPGEVGVPNLLAMARAGLRSELGAALREAKTTHESATRRGLRVKTNGDFTSVDLAVHPVAAELDTPLFLVMLEAAREAASLPSTTTSPEPSVDADARIAALEEELHAQEDYLRSANDELETANQELTSTNEEMQSVNEELRSTNEELETAQEELQSTNEELATVNSELQTRLGDFSRTNNDMSNLLAGTGIGTLFVDLHLRILRFTPAAVRIINLIPADVGRPLAHVVTNLVGSADLLADAQAVLDTLVPKEVRVRTKEGAWYTMRILPYRTLENVIEGAVLTFVDITETVRVQEALRKTNELQRLAIVVRDAHDAITVQDLDGRTLAWNAGAERLYGWTEAEALAMNVRERIPEALRDDALGKLAQLSKAEVLEPYRTRRLDKAGKVVAVSLISTALHDETGRMYGIATTERAVAS